MIEPFVEIGRLPQSLGGLSGGSAAPLPRCLLAEPRSSPPRRPGVMDRDARVRARPNVRAFITFDDAARSVEHAATRESGERGVQRGAAHRRGARSARARADPSAPGRAVRRGVRIREPAGFVVRAMDPVKPEHALELLPPEANTAEASGRRPRPRPSRVGFQSPHQTSGDERPGPSEN